MHSSGAFSSLLLGTLNRRGDTDSLQLEEGICGSNLRVRAGVMAIHVARGRRGKRLNDTASTTAEKLVFVR